MTESKQALLIIDYTNDFVADQGALTCGKPAQAIEQQIIDLANQFLRKQQWVVLPTDLHYKNNPYHPETKLFPPHNLGHSWGRQFYGKLQTWYDKHKDDSHVLMLDKTRYSAFCGTNLDLFLRERHVHTLHLTGVCTDICVLHTAIDAYNKCYQLVIHRDACASFNQTGHQWALQHFKNCLGAQIVD